MNKDYEKIIEFICNSPEIPEDLAADLRSWMLAHSDDENLTEALRREWDLRFGKTGTPVSSEALGRLLREVAPAEPEQRQTSRFRRLPRLPRLLRYAAVAAAIYDHLTLTGPYRECLIEQDAEDEKARRSQEDSL